MPNDKDLDQLIQIKKKHAQVKPKLSHSSSSNTIAGFQKTFGNIASIRFLGQNEMIQPKLRAGHSLILDESKEHFSDTSEALESQKSSHLTSVQPRIQRFPADDSASQTEQTSPVLDTPATTTTQDATTQTAQTATRPLIVEDSFADLEPGQMRKTEFLNQLRPAVCQTSESALTGTIWSAMGCPWIDRWFNYYSGRSAVQIEQSLRGYTPGASTVIQAGAYIPLVCQKIHQAIHTWTTTGEITGVPDEMAGSLPLPTGSDASENNSDTGTFGRAGNMLSGLGSLFFKEKSDHSIGARGSNNLHGQLSPGHPLSSSIKSRMEPVFGQDFSNVRIHTESKDANISHELNARAFTFGSDIVFGRGEYQPGFLVGDALIAHELAHVVQQSNTEHDLEKSIRADKTLDSLSTPLSDNASLEEEADLLAVKAVMGLHTNQTSPAGGLGKSRLSTIRQGLQLQRCRGCDSEQRPDLQTRIRSIYDAESLIAELQDLDENQLQQLQNEVTGNSFLENGIRWELAFRNKEWSQVAQLHQDDTNLFFLSFQWRLVEAIIQGETSIQIHGNEDFQSFVESHLNDLTGIPTGFRLIIELLATGQTVDIRSTTSSYSSSTLMPDDNTQAGRLITMDDELNPLPYDQQRPGQAAGSNVFLNPELADNQVTLGGTAGNFQIIEQESTVTLGHELIHALHNALGTNIAPPSVGGTVLRALGRPNYLVRDPATGEVISPEEPRTISGQLDFQPPTGVDPQSVTWPTTFNVPQDPITENMLRRELDLPERASHGGGRRGSYVQVESGQTLNQCLSRYYLEDGQAIPSELASAIRTVFLEFNPYFQEHSSLPMSIRLEFPHSEYIYLHVSFVRNQPVIGEMARRLRIRGAE